MLYWLIILLAAVILLTGTALVYAIPAVYRVIPASGAQRVFTNIALSYPMAFLILLFLLGDNPIIPNTKYHPPSAFVFFTGHALLSILCLAAAIYRYKFQKYNIVFIFSNSLAGLAYITYIILLAMLGFMHHH